MINNQLIKNLRNKRVLVMGLGLHGGGLSITRWLVKKGARVTVTDLKSKKELLPSLKKLRRFPINFVLGRHRLNDFRKADLIIQNPGVPNNSKFLKTAQKNKIPIENEAGIFFNLCPANIIGITGTRGKSTVSYLTCKILKNKYDRVFLAGNIRIKSMFDIVDNLKKDDTVVLELSSWHLEGLKKHRLSPKFSLITNIFPDHLNRYRTFKDYIEAKQIIFKYQRKNDICCLNFDNKIVKGFENEVHSKIFWFSKKYQKDLDGCFLQDNRIIFKNGQKKLLIGDKKDIKLRGSHNLENVLGSVCLAAIFKVNPCLIKKTIQNFSGLEDRLQLVRNIKAIKFYNDTTATIPEATISALRSFPNKVILIAGGTDKKLNYSGLAKEIRSKVTFLILLKGNATDKLKEQLRRVKFGKIVLETQNIFEAVKKARKLAQKNDIILFSPAAASFGLFVNEFDRGEKFKKAVLNLD